MTIHYQNSPDAEIIEPGDVISAAEEPEKANQAVQQIMGIPKAVDVVEPPDTLVELPGGYIAIDKTIYTEAEVREMNGEDEEVLARANMKNVGRFVTSLLERCVVRLGPVEAKPEMLSELLVGDREMLLLAIRKASYGDTIEMQLTCPTCQAQLEVAVELEKDIPIRKLEEPEIRLFTVKLRNGEATVRLPIGADQDALNSMVGKTMAEVNTALLQRCVKTLHGKPVMGPMTVRALGVKDRKTIIEFLANTQPGPQFDQVKQECTSCGKEWPIPIDLVDLFRG